MELYHIMTDDNAPIGCEFGFARTDEKSREDMLTELDTLAGFIFDANYVSDDYIKINFFGSEPEYIDVLYTISGSPGEYKAEYPIKVPEQTGEYNFFVSIDWGGGSVETAYFRVTVTAEEAAG